MSSLTPVLNWDKAASISMGKKTLLEQKYG
jgi:hypothetical protein